MKVLWSHNSLSPVGEIMMTFNFASYISLRNVFSLRNFLGSGLLANPEASDIKYLVSQDATRVKWNVYDVNDVNHDKYIEELTKAVEKLEKVQKFSSAYE